MANRVSLRPVSACALFRSATDARGLKSTAIIRHTNMAYSTSSQRQLRASVSPLAHSLPAPDDASDLKHHRGKKGFMNPWASYVDPGGFRIGRKVLLRKIRGTENKPDTTPPTVPVHSPRFLTDRISNQQSLRMTWLGHACVLAEFPSGLRVLFDPVFTPRCSPFSFLGPQRYTKAPCDISEIPKIDVVVISHNHYDHLSHPTIMEIVKSHPEAHYFVPLGLAPWFHSSAIEKVTELDWWESRQLHLAPAAAEEKHLGIGNDESMIQATIGCLPSQHQTARSGFDRCKTLWASWSVESGGKSLWFGGDTGYRSVPEASEGEDDYSEKWAHLHRCPAFEQIGRLRGPFDVGLIPIGAYAPRFIMSPMHSNPEDAVNIFMDVKAKHALGIHWGTWVLTEEDVLEPPRLVREALKKKYLPLDAFKVCDIGQSLDF